MDMKDMKFNESLSQEFSAKDMNVLVFDNVKTHKHLYLKVGKKNKDSQIELIPLDTNELRDLELSESLTETVNGELFDISIEESVDETSAVQPLKRVANFDVTNAESMKAARQLADEQLKKLEEAENGKQMFTNVRSSLEKKYNDEGLNAPTVANIDEMNDASLVIKTIKNLKAQIPSTPQSTPSGTVPLSSQTPAQQNQSFGDYPSMISDLRKRAETDPISREALSQLMYKSLKGARETTLPAYQEPQKQMVTTDLIENGMLTAKPDICNLAHNYREKRLRSMAEHGDAQAQNILDSGNY